MNASHDDNLTPLDPAIESELYGLLAQLCDGVATADERSRISKILNESTAARLIYLRYIALHGLLVTGAGNTLGYSAVDSQLAVERLAISRLGESISASPISPAVVRPSRQSRRLKYLSPWFGAISAVILAVAAIYLWSQPKPPEVGIQAADKVRQQSDERVPSSESQRLVAEVTFVSESAVWQTPNSSYALASNVRAGQSLALVRGQVELTYETGAKLLLTGPTDFFVQSGGGKLRRGELVARVPKAGHGFTIETPHGKVIDLGTEFGVVVDDFGVSQVSVFEGKVETLPLSNAGKAGELIELTSGRALQWTERSVTPISIKGKRYPVTPGGRRMASLPAAAKNTIEEDFRSEPPAPARWISIGDVSPDKQGLRLGTDVMGGRHPYLLSTREFDPTQGAVNIVCDVRFEDILDVEHASFAILTRGSSKPSKPNLPWSDMLARSVRCRFGTNPATGEGALEAGTKFEADREITNVSWGGFSRPQPNALYRLEMRDDGLNVTFTVSLVANPSVRKTIICRSLFRGDENFVALEGSNAGTAIVERLAITQEELPRDGATSLAASDTDKTAPTVVKADVAQQLAALAPNNAELLMQEDFNGESLNPTLWTTLGSVIMRGGQVQLGTRNADETIDTWRPRPYLLTREPFDLAGGPITILGQVTFDENFLHGYGGSFAVMTRADKSYGGGPTWERSILRRGVRSNFWPAAYGFDHSLEIHERPNPDAVSLLTAVGFNISPQSRTYLFMVVDDGKSASLTLLDADQPQVRKTISHATTTDAANSGVIGFESCWGSPVQLDNIRIYRTKPATPNSAPSNPQKP